MHNEQLVNLSRAIVTAVRGTDTFDAGQLRKLFLRVVPELLAEIEILSSVSSFSLPEPAEEKPASRNARRRRKKRRA